MTSWIRWTSIAAVTLIASACAMKSAPAPATPAMAMDGVLVGSNQMTLYTFDRDAAASGKSVCNGPCATNWPPLMAAADAKDAGDWMVITRDDGAKQWAFKGKPLYFWIKDTKPGDKTGDGVNNVWRLAKP
jgi:predicted lipoprotein with Yx(FWY)xxD motif